MTGWVVLTKIIVRLLIKQLLSAVRIVRHLAKVLESSSRTAVAAAYEAKERGQDPERCTGLQS